MSEVPTVTTRPYMYQRRPQWVIDQINNRFSFLNKRGQPNYGNNGEVDDYVFQGKVRGEYDLDAPRDIWTSELISELSENHGRTLRVLDIGAGAGAFVLRCIDDGHDAFGLSAEDYKKSVLHGRTAELVPASAYIIGDAHNLARIPELPNDFDVIVSQYAFMHFRDPLSVLEQAVNKLRPGGVFVSDVIDDWGAYQQDVNTYMTHTVIDAIHQAGLQTEGTYLRWGDLEFSRVAIQNSENIPDLRLPVNYSETPRVPL